MAAAAPRRVQSTPHLRISSDAYGDGPGRPSVRGSSPLGSSPIGIMKESAAAGREEIGAIMKGLDTLTDHLVGLLGSSSQEHLSPTRTSPKPISPTRASSVSALLLSRPAQPAPPSSPSLSTRSSTALSPARVPPGVLSPTGTNPAHAPGMLSPPGSSAAHATDPLGPSSHASGTLSSGAQASGALAPAPGNPPASGMHAPTPPTPSSGQCAPGSGQPAPGTRASTALSTASGPPGARASTTLGLGPRPSATLGPGARAAAASSSHAQGGPGGSSALYETITQLPLGRPRTASATTRPPKAPSPGPDSDTFVGVAALLEQHAITLRKFEQWARTRSWRMFTPQYSHYDWWMFPISEPSRTYGYRYALPPDAVRALRDNAGFMERWWRGVVIMLQSWGWDVAHTCWYARPDPRQAWERYDIRLRKLGQSVLLLGDSAQRHAVHLFSLALLERFPATHMAPLPFHSPY